MNNLTNLQELWEKTCSRDSFDSFESRMNCLKHNSTTFCKFYLNSTNSTNYNEKKSDCKILIDGFGKYDPCMQKFEEGSSVDQILISNISNKPLSKIEHVNCAQKFCGVKPTQKCLKNFKSQICHCCIQAGTEKHNQNICNTICSSSKQDCLKQICGSEKINKCVSNSVVKMELCNCCKEHKSSCLFESVSNPSGQIDVCKDSEPKDSVESFEPNADSGFEHNFNNFNDFRKPDSTIRFNSGLSEYYTNTEKSQSITIILILFLFLLLVLVIWTFYQAFKLKNRNSD